MRHTASRIAPRSLKLFGQLPISMLGSTLVSKHADTHARSGFLTDPVRLLESPRWHGGPNAPQARLIAVRRDRPARGPVLLHTANARAGLPRTQAAASASRPVLI